MNTTTNRRPEITIFGASANGGRTRQFTVSGLCVQVRPDYEDDNARAERLVHFLADAAAQFEASEPTPVQPSDLETTEPTIVAEPIMSTHTPVATTRAVLTTGTRVLIVKGCKERGIAKGVTCVVVAIDPLGADYSYSVRVQLRTLNGVGSGKVVSFFARHTNRLSDPIVRMNDGNPSRTIEVRRA